MFCLFANKSNPKEPFEALRENNLNNNKNNSNVKSFENDYQARKGKLAILREIMRAIIQKAIEEAPLRESSEECAIQLHHYTPQDEIDKGMFCLFANKSNPKEPFEALRENNLNNNKNNSNVKSFENDYQARKGKLAILREIMRAIIQKAIEEYNWSIFGINV
ncbi:hypothetical protein Glove_139g6 [Diversispora epigaea]|uniref:Uncharacterized protein n=1 Tax=Diversispora epigaea TaxID=1348612 RepID=A0A397J497_9GLOM|nr:hypothetical protein Glove_139g6 [Diversispora epigaea]